MDVLLPLGIWAAFTAIGAVMLAFAASNQVALEHTVPGYTVTEPLPAAPGYFGVITNWDGNWYRAIAESGYPRALPVDSHGAVAQNVWAFYPLYPMLVRGVMAVTGLGFAQAAWLTSLTFGAAAMIALFSFVRGRMGRFGAAAVVSCVMAYVAAPVLQVAYTEGLALLLIVAFMAALQSRQLGVACGIALLLSLARPIALPLGVVTGVVLLLDWLRDRRAEGEVRIPMKSILATGAVLATAAVWPVIAWVVTGRRDAFFQTQAAWPVNQNGLGGWLGDMVHMTRPGLLGIAVVGIVALVNVRPRFRLWGRELQLWSIAYPAYLVAASRPSPSILRYFMLAIVPLCPFPELALSWVRGSRRAATVFLAVVIGGGLVAQFYWVTHVFAVTGDPALQSFP